MLSYNQSYHMKILWQNKQTSNISFSTVEHQLYQAFKISRLEASFFSTNLTRQEPYTNVSANQNPRNEHRNPNSKRSKEPQQREHTNPSSLSFCVIESSTSITNYMENPTKSTSERKAKSRIFYYHPGMASLQKQGENCPDILYRKDETNSSLNPWLSPLLLHNSVRSISSPCSVHS